MCKYQDFLHQHIINWIIPLNISIKREVSNENKPNVQQCWSISLILTLFYIFLELFFTKMFRYYRIIKFDRHYKFQLWKYILFLIINATEVLLFMLIFWKIYQKLQKISTQLRSHFPRTNNGYKLFNYKIWKLCFYMLYS